MRFTNSSIPQSSTSGGASGFTLVEVLLSVAILGMISAALFASILLQRDRFYISFQNNQSALDAGSSMTRILNGQDGFWGLQEASYGATVIDPTTPSGGGWTITADQEPASETQRYVYNPATDTITIRTSATGVSPHVITDVTDSDVYDDAGFLILMMEISEEVLVVDIDRGQDVDFGETFVFETRFQFEE